MDVERYGFIARLIVLLTTALLAACSGLPPVAELASTPQPQAVDTLMAPTDAPTPTLIILSLMPSPTPYPWDDENAVMSGLCFESVDDAAERTYVIHNDAELTAFFDLADHSELCRHPVRRTAFDFSGGRILAGLWSKAKGCAAQHQVTNILRDDTAQTYTVFLTLNVTVGCDYELVRPFWIGLSGMADYDVRLVVVR